MSIKETNKKIEETVIGGYKKIEDAVVGGYKKIEDKFVDTFIKDENETTEEAKERIIQNQEEIAKEKEKRIEDSLKSTMDIHDKYSI